MSSPAEDLLIEDYRYRAESLWRNEQGGETRVNLFIGLVTLTMAVYGSIGASVRGLQGEASPVAAMAILAALLVLGVTTMLRMITRNRNTDEAKHQLDQIRQTFKDHLDHEGILRHYDPFRPQEGSSGRLKPRRFGGLCHTMAALNSLVVSGIAVLVLESSLQSSSRTGEVGGIPRLVTYLAVLAVFSSALYAQVCYIDREDKKGKDRLKGDEPNRVGGVVYKKDGEEVKYLVARPRSGANEWILPKGHIELGEGHIEAALREMREETGVFARAICLVDRVRFRVQSKGGEDLIDAKYYLMERVSEESPRETRGVAWLPVGDALKALTHEEGRSLVLEAERRRMLMRLGGNGCECSGPDKQLATDNLRLVGKTREDD